MPIDYSRWKDIEISDDEDDTHPNVDTPSLFKWRHEARLKRMADMAEKKSDVQEHIDTYAKRMENIKFRLTNETLDEDTRKALHRELDEVREQEEEWRRKEEQLRIDEERGPWNVDTISHEVFTMTRINKSAPPPEPVPLTDEEENQFYEKNMENAERFALLRKYDDSERYLIEHTELCCTETANLLSLIALNYELDGKSELMLHVAHQVVIINYLVELAKYLKTNPKTPSLISAFFNKLRAAQSDYMDMFKDDIDAVAKRIKNRAREKIEEAVKAEEEEQRQKRLGPGGLDPLEVFETLPPAMKKCFETQDVEMLKRVAIEMKDDDFDYHFKRCVDSGLWVPKKDENDDEDEEKSQVAGTSVSSTENDALSTSQPN